MRRLLALLSEHVQPAEGAVSLRTFAGRKLYAISTLGPWLLSSSRVHRVAGFTFPGGHRSLDRAGSYRELAGSEMPGTAKGPFSETEHPPRCGRHRRHHHSHPDGHEASARRWDAPRF